MCPMVLRLLAVFLVFGLCAVTVRTSVDMMAQGERQQAAAKPARELASGPVGVNFAATPGRAAQ